MSIAYKLPPAPPVPPKPQLNPRLSDRTAAAFMRLPAVEQMKILHDQKYPKQAPQAFMRPFYRDARNGIREIISNGAAGLIAARGMLQAIPPGPRRQHSQRVVEWFASSIHPSRGLILIAQKRIHAVLGKFELRMSPDIVAMLGGQERYIYVNFKAAKLDPEDARVTLELAHWLLEQNGIKVKPEQLEFIDPVAGVLYTGKKRRVKTIKLLEANAKVIENMWPTIDP